jgi:gamma-glutamylcysteine synthetase
MTEVKARNNEFIRTPADAEKLYKGNGQPEEDQCMGFETEIFLYSNSAGAPRGASAQECSRLLKLLELRGEKPQLEMASAVELASNPHRVGNIGKLTGEIASSYAIYKQGIADTGLLPAEGALLPFTTLESARGNLVDRDRARGLVSGMEKFKAPEFLKVTLLCTSTQVSLSYGDTDDLLDMARTAYALGPAITGIFANHPHFIEGNPVPVNTHPRAAFYEAFGTSGGIPESFLTAKDGDDFIKKHVQHVHETEMLFYYDHDNKTVWPEKPVAYKDLEKSGLNTRSNYDLAESFIYTDVKLCSIRDAEGNATGKRIELRGFDAGEPGVQGAAPFAHAVLRDPVANEQVRGLLMEYGFDPDSDGYAERLKKARHDAAFHGGKFLDVPFGVKPDGTEGSLKDFAQGLGQVLKLYARRHPETATALEAVIEVCETGVPLAQKIAEATPDYNAALRRLRGPANDSAPQKPGAQRFSL